MNCSEIKKIIVFLIYNKHTYFFKLLKLFPPIKLGYRESQRVLSRKAF